MSELLKFGKYRGQTVEDVAKKDISYLQWMVQNVNEKVGGLALQEAKKIVKDTSLDLPNSKFTGTLVKRIQHIIGYPENELNKLRDILQMRHVASQKTLGMHELSTILTEIQSCYPSGNGCFIDYLIRRLIAEISGKKELYDHRANEMLSCYIVKTNEPAFPELIEGYAEYRDTSKPTESIIKQVFDTSTVHNKFFDCHDYDKSPILECEIIKNVTPQVITNLKERLRSLLPSYTDVSQVLLNPTLGSSGIPADADIIIGDTLIDIKVTIREPTNYEYFQLMGYAALAECHDIKINHVLIWNPLINKEYKFDITDWKHEHRESFIDLLSNKITFSELIKQKNEI